MPTAQNIFCYDISKNAKYILTGGNNIKLWEIESGKLLATYILTCELGYIDEDQIAQEYFF